MPSRAAQSVFLLPHGGRYILYAPVRGVVCEVNPSAARALREHILPNGPEHLPATVSQALGDIQWLRTPDALTHADPDREFAPCSVTIFPTNRCNLRCTYCYASAGEHEYQTIGEEVWQAAVDLAFSNASRNSRPLDVGFHGGGEPTVAWEVITSAVAYATKLCRKHSPGLRLSLATNGMFGAAKAGYIASHFQSVVLSMDGPEDIQDHQRPKAAGGGSSRDVLATASGLADAGCRFGIRATVTSRSVSRMTELVGYFRDEARCTMVHFEPAFGCGRCADNYPGGDEFADGFIAALRHGARTGVRVRYSGARSFGPHSSFCGVANDGFSVTPEGLITSCFQVCDSADPLADTFVYGHFDQGTGSFRIDFDKLRRLRGLVVPNKPCCDRCFCRWQCAGDCPFRVLTAREDLAAPSPRCEMNQRILKAMLIHILEGPRDREQ